MLLYIYYVHGISRAMKKLFIAAVLTIASLSIVIGTNLPKSQTPIEAQILTFDGYVEPVTASEPLESTETQELSKVSTITQNTVTEASEEPTANVEQDEFRVYNAVSPIVLRTEVVNQFLKKKSQLITVSILKLAEQRPELFQESNLEQTVVSCIAYYDSNFQGYVNIYKEPEFAIARLTHELCQI